MIIELLKNNNVKVTKQRVEVLEAIVKLESDASIKNILDECSDIDKSTVYRSLDTLIENNIVDKTILGSEVIYELKSNHKHYLKCVKCNKTEVLDDCPFEDEDIKGYKILNHVVNIEGICEDCQKK